MEVFEIVSYDGIHRGYAEANNERQALCLYLMNHEELTDMMLWKSSDYPDIWKLAEYDNEDEYLYARRARRF